MRVLFSALLTLMVIACVRTPSDIVAGSVDMGDAWTPPGRAYNLALDGATLNFNAPLTDAVFAPDAGLPNDVPPVQDLVGADVPIVADIAKDIPVIADAPPTWPAGAPTVQSAFSPDGKSVKVRFNKPMDPVASAGGLYTITNTSNNSVKVLSAALAPDPQFVALTLDPVDVGKINPSLTYTVLVKNVKAQDGEAIGASNNKAPIKRTVYLQILWHQHQPTYLDPVADELKSPWVRKHATKDYYDMAAILQQYPDVHVTINLTPVLLNQLLPYYIDRLGPYVDIQKNTVDAAGFLAKWANHTDPWIDLLLSPTPEPASATVKQIGLLYADPWSCVSTAPVLMNRFPAYAELRAKNPAALTKDDLLALKIWFEIAWMDPDFLTGPVKMPNGVTVDLTDIIAANNGSFSLKVPPSEQMANRIVAEEFKIMQAVVPIHKQLMYHADTFKGQIEIATTPFYHPILPLVHNTELMGQGQPFDAKPVPAFSFPQDAAAQVGRAVALYQSIFGEKPRGMWPGEGSVAEDVIQHFNKHGILWVATDQKVMEQSGKFSGGSPVGPWLADGDKQAGNGGDDSDDLAIFFRNTTMSNDIGFKYQGMWGTDAADDLLKNTSAQAPGFGAGDRVITLVLDGENAWETFVKEHDGKGFFHALYGKLTQAQAAGQIITVTGSEYILGNPQRNVPAHPVNKLPELEPVFPGSWIDGNFAIWIGEEEENTAWKDLAQARTDLQKSGLVQPDPYILEPKDKTTVDYHIWKAFDEIYASEGSDWFWWYGSDMTSPSNDDSPFDQAFRTHLGGMYARMNAALQMQGKATIVPPEFKPIIQANPQQPQGPLNPVPTMDGLFSPNEGEWTKDGGFFFDSDTAGALANPDDWMATIYYGSGNLNGKDGLFMAVQHNFDLNGVQNGGLAVYFSHKHIVDPATGTTQEDPAVMQSRFGDILNFQGKGASRELFVALSGGSATPELHKSDGTTTNWATLGKVAFNGKVGGPVKGGKLLELFIPWTDLGLVAGDPIAVQLVFGVAGKGKDVAPSLESKPLIADPTAAVFVTFTCDVSGKDLAIDTFGNISNWPPPKGKGIVFIAGNDPKLGMKAKWVPNKIALLDDGKGADVLANDQIWTGVFAFTKGQSLKYKYTIGITANEGQWGGTEEFPLTERGLEVSKDPKVKKVKVSDTFADRPPQTGGQGTKTQVTAE